jgi:hypothetical protein
MEAMSSGREVVTAKRAAPRKVWAMPVDSAMAFTLRVAMGAVRKIRKADTPKRTQRPPNETCAAFSLHPVGFCNGILGCSTPGRAKNGMRRNHAIDTT